MVKAQEWLNRKYPTPEAKAAVKRIGPNQNPTKKFGDDLLSAVSKDRDLSSVFSSLFDNAINKNNQVEDNLNLEGSLSFKGFVNLEELDISNQKITALDISDCSRLRDLNCSNNQLTDLELSNNQQIEQINFSGNQLTNLNLKGLTKIEKIFCSDNQLTSLEFLKNLSPTEIRTLRMGNNKFPAQDLSCFARLIGLNRLFIENMPFYGSLKPLRNLTELKEIGINGTNIDSGLEYLPDSFFKINSTASSLGLTGGYFKRSLYCSGKLTEQLKGYEVKDNPLMNYDWPRWRKDNADLIAETNNLLQKELKAENANDNWETETNFSDNKTLMGDFITKLEKASEENEDLQIQLIDKQEELNSAKKLLANFTTSYENISEQIEKKKTELEILKNSYLEKQGDWNKDKLNKNLEQILEAQIDNGPYARSHKEKIKEKIVTKTLLSFEELDTICQKQEKLFSLESELGVVKERIKETKEKITIINNYNYGSITSNQGHVFFGNQIDGNTNSSYNNSKEEELQQKLNSFWEKQKEISYKQIIKNQQEKPNSQNLINFSLTSQQTQDWINISPPAQQEQASQEPAFYAWLRDIKNLTPEQVLNSGNLSSLRQEYQSQQQAQIQQANIQEITLELEKTERQLQSYYKNSESNLAETIKKFIETNKNFTKNKENDKARKDTEKLYEELNNKNLSEIIEQIIEGCEKIVGLELLLERKQTKISLEEKNTVNQSQQQTQIRQSNLPFKS